MLTVTASPRPDYSAPARAVGPRKNPRPWLGEQQVTGARAVPVDNAIRFMPILLMRRDRRR